MEERPRAFVGPVIGAVHGASLSASFGPLSDFSADTYLVFTSQADTTACTRGSCLSGFDIWTAVDGQPASVVRAATHSQTFVVVDPAAGRAGPALGGNCRAFNAGPLPVIVGSLDVEPSTAGSDTLDYWNVGAFTATDTYSCGKAARSNAVTSQNNACIFVPSSLDSVCSMTANLGWVLWSRDNAAPEVDAGSGTYGGVQIGNGDTVAIKCTDAATFRCFEATTAAFNTSIGFRIAVRHFNRRQHRREGQCGCSRLRRYHPRRHHPQRPPGGRHGRTTELRRLRNASMIHRVIFLLLALAAPAFGTTYYVDPSTGSNASSGTSMAAPWKTPPGTRNAADTAYLNTAWGAITTSNKLQCGDTILLKGGQTYSAAQGGAWCITDGGGCAASGSYYTATCTGSNPITIRVATNAEWPGSTGSFMIDGSAIDPADSASFNYAGMISISHVNGVVLSGASPSQRLVVSNTAGDGNVAAGINMDGNINGITVKYVDVSLQYVGVAMGDISDSIVSDAILHDNGGPAINCGDQVHHNCLRVGWVNIESYGNGPTSGTYLSYCDSLYIQGAQQLYVLNPYIHDNTCSGLNIGAGDHTYPYVARTLVRDAVFSHNGTFNNSNSARANFQGAGDVYPSEAGAPSMGYCSGGPNDGAVCSNQGDCSNFGCTIYDSYATFERIVSFGAFGPGAYVPHGSGFTWMNRMTLFNNDLALQPGGGQFEDDSVAGDHVMTNSILVNRSGTPLFTWNTNGIHKVCRQNCPNAGIPCAVDSDCGACAASSLPACYQYRPMMGGRNNLFRPTLGGSNSEGMTTYGFICDSSCTGGTAGTTCSSDSQCTGCSAGCVWAGGGTTFSGALSALHFFLDGDGSNKIGSAYDPLFANVTATNCANGTDALACDFDLQPGSPAIDAGTFLMLTNGSGSNSTSLTVTENVKSPGTLDFNGKNGDPATFFIPQNGYPGYAGDTIQIQGATCPTGNPVVVSMSGSTITLDRSCSWSDGMGVDLPWNGSAPDMGALESEAATSTLPATTTTTRTATSTLPATTTTTKATTSTLPATTTSTKATTSTLPATTTTTKATTSTLPATTTTTMTAPPTSTTLPTTTSTSSMSSTTSTSLATSSTTTTTSVTSSTTLLRGNGHGHRHRSGGG